MPGEWRGTLTDRSGGDPRRPRVNDEKGDRLMRRSGFFRRIGVLGAAAVVAGSGAAMALVPAGTASAATYNCSAQLTATNNLCVDGAGGVLTVTPSGNLSPLVLNNVQSSFLGSVTSSGAISVPVSGASWGPLTGTLSGVTANITITDAGTVTGTYDASTGVVTESGTLTILLSAVSGPCTYNQPFSATGTLGAFTKGASFSTATGTMTQATVPVAVGETPAAGNPTGSGCALAEAVLKGATQKLTLPVTVDTTETAFSSPAAAPTTTAPSTTASSPTTTAPSTTTSPSTVPSATTGEPWSGWPWWAGVSGIALLGLALLSLAAFRRSGRAKA